MTRTSPTPSPARAGDSLTVSHSARVVFDTNVVLSALVFTTSTSVALRRTWQTGAYTPLASAATVAELVRAIAYPKFELSAAERDELLADYLPWCNIVGLLAQAPRKKVPRCRDPHDEPFLELAIAGEAELLVTGDADLLALAGEVSFSIVSPAAFLERAARRK